jgi:TolB-like protein/DNA-binding winged helix-turn-helix (wHTH) protein
MKAGQDPDAVEFAGFRLERGARRLLGPDGAVITLRPKVFDTLVVLAGRVGEVVDKRELLDAVWPGVFVEENNLSQTISALRKALGDTADEPRIIVTAPGRGFQLVAPVRVAESRAPESASRAAPPVPIRGFRPSRLWIVVGGLAVLIAAAAIVAAGLGRPGPVAQAAREPSIAVLPFLDLSEAGDQGYLADGITEELTAQLALTEGLRVAGRTSAYAFKDRREDVRVIGEALGVAHVLEGSLRRDRDRLRITAQLIGAADGYHLWLRTYDRDLGDLLQIQKEIAREVATALSIEIGLVPGAIVSLASTNDPEAYDLALRARAAITAQPPDLLGAEALFRSAVERDPEYASAWIGLLATLESIAYYDAARREDAQRESSAIAERVVAMASGLDAFAAFRQAIDRDELLQARTMLDLAQSGALAMNWTGANVLLNFEAGRPSAVVEALRELVRANPSDLDASGNLHAALYALGRFDEAEAEYRRSRSLRGNRAVIEVHAVFAALDRGLPREEVEDRARRFRASFPVGSRGDAFDVVALLDDREAALAGLRRELARADDPAGMGPLGVAWWATHFDDMDLAIEALRSSLTLQGVQGLGVFDPALAGARKDPRFKDIVREHGYLDYWRQTGEWSDFCRPLGADDFECS